MPVTSDHLISKFTQAIRHHGPYRDGSWGCVLTWHETDLTKIDGRKGTPKWPMKCWYWSIVEQFLFNCWSTFHVWCGKLLPSQDFTPDQDDGQNYNFTQRPALVFIGVRFDRRIAFNLNGPKWSKMHQKELPPQRNDDDDPELDEYEDDPEDRNFKKGSPVESSCAQRTARTMRKMTSTQRMSLIPSLLDQGYIECMVAPKWCNRSVPNDPSGLEIFYDMFIYVHMQYIYIYLYIYISYRCVRRIVSACSWNIKGSKSTVQRIQAKIDLKSTLSRQFITLRFWQLWYYVERATKAVRKPIAMMEQPELLTKLEPELLRGVSLHECLSGFGKHWRRPDAGMSGQPCCFFMFF